MSAYKIGLLALEKSVLWFALATSVEYAVLAAIMLITYRRHGGPRLSTSFDMAKSLLSKSLPFVAAGLMVAVYASTDRLMLKQMLDESAVGYYSLAVSVSTMWVFILSAVIDSLYPVIVELHKKSVKEYEQKNRQLYAIVFYVALTVSASICLFAEPIVGTLYGEAYLPAVGPLRVVVWYTAFSYLGVARNAWVVCEGKQRYLKWLYAVAAAVNVLLNVALIPLHGAVGAAVASLVTQVSTTLILPALIKPLRPNAKLMLDAVLLRDVLPKRGTVRGEE